MRKLLLLSITLLSFSILAEEQHDCLNIKFEDQQTQDEYNKRIEKRHCKVDFKIKYINGKAVYEIEGKNYIINNGKYLELKQYEKIENDSDIKKEN